MSEDLIEIGKEIELELIQWELTKECNLHCPFCYADSGPDKISDNEYNSSERKEIFKKLKQIGLEELQFLGGEPLLKKDTILYALRENEGNISHFTITTNGTLITEELVEELKPYKDKLSIQIALDGAKEETHDSLRGKGTYKKVISGIKILNENNINWGTTLLATNKNFDELEEIVEKVEEKGGEYIQILKLRRGGREENFYAKAGLSAEEKDKTRNKIKKLVDKYPDLVFTESFVLPYHKNRLEKAKEDEESFLGCGTGLMRVSIFPNKIMSPCVGIRENSLLAEKIEDLDIKGTYQKIKDKYLKKVREYKKQRCQECEYREECFPRSCQIEADMEKCPQER